MARINVDDAIYRDPRFFDLCIKLGNRFLALGVCVAAWDLGQKWYLRSPHKTIPIDEWNKSGIPQGFLEVGLGFPGEGGIHVCGIDRYAQWIEKCKIAGAHGRAKQLENSPGVPQGTLDPSGLLPLPLPLKKKNTTLSSETTHPIFEIWNYHRGTLPRCKTLSSGRKRTAISRWKENPSEEYWSGIVKRLAASEFCNGKNNRSWRADFDFLIKPDTHARVIEGKYDDRSQSSINTIPIDLGDLT